MTPRRMMTSLSALALGFAMTAAVPALAQTNTQSTAPSGTSGAAPAPAAPAPAAPAPAAPANTGTSAATNSNTTGKAAQSTTQKGQMQSMTHKPKMTHHVATRERTARRYASSGANPNAQDSEVDRLNQQSLQAAQQGRSFSPSGHM